jgi:hypothetical protein
MLGDVLEEQTPMGAYKGAQDWTQRDEKAEHDTGRAWPKSGDTRTPCSVNGTLANRFAALVTPWYCPSLGYAKMYQTFSTASTTLRMYFNFYIVVEKCIFYGMVILVFLFLNSVEVQQTSKFARTSATFCHMASRRLSVCGPPSNCLSK